MCVGEGVGGVNDENYKTGKLMSHYSRLSLHWMTCFRAEEARNLYFRAHFTARRLQRARRRSFVNW